MVGKQNPNPFLPSSPIPHSSQSTAQSLPAAGGMEDEDKKPSGCCLFVLYNSFRRRPVPISPLNSTSPSAGSNGTIHNSNSRHPIPSQPPSLLLPPNHTKPPAAYQAKLKQAGPVPRPRNDGISSDLDSMIYDHQRAKGSSTLVRASSGNVMLHSNLGNLRAPGAVAPNRNVFEYLPKTAKEMRPARRGGEFEATPSICRAVSRLDPEEIKEMGNEEYKNGRYAEAVALYDRAISIDPEKATYWSNKASALIGLGRLLDAVEEYREALSIDPYYFRAHLRLANLYIRLGEPQKAAKHYKLAKDEASYDDITRAKAMQNIIVKCGGARNLREWSLLLKESQSAISAGADSSPQIFAYRAEAFLMLLRMEDAADSMIDAPKFETDASTKFFGAPNNAYYLSVRAQVDMAAGNFENAISLAQMAAQIHPGSCEIASVARKARSVASARSMGNNLFMASKFEEACLAYGAGLKHDPHNAILLCNLAACRFKLGQWQKAIEDCNAALNLHPKYSKARQRRADCNAKLEQWEASVEDYEVLVLEMKGDETVSKALQEAKEHLRRQSVDGITEALPISNKGQPHGVMKSSGEYEGKRLLSKVEKCELSA